MLIEFIKGALKGDGEAVIYAILYVICVLIALTVHECFHGLTAYALGDPTAKYQGRLSLNPKYHLDPIGAIMMLIFGFGWAKPVPVNASYFKNRKTGMAITALAGPLSNILLSFLGYLGFYLLYFGIIPIDNVTPYIVVLLNFFNMFCIVNISLAIFNLIPVPPLDGSRILNIILPEKYYFKVMMYERYIYLGVVLALFTGILDKPLIAARDFVLDIFFNILSAIF